MRRDFTVGSNKKVVDFLGNDLFISWRLFLSKELEEYWIDFISNNPHLEEDLHKAIDEFDDIFSREEENIADREQVKARIESSIKRHRKTRRIYHFTAAVAAVAFLLISSTFLTMYFKGGGNKEIQELIVGKVIVDNEIQLFMGEEVVNIDNNSTLSLSQDDDGTVIQDSLIEKSFRLVEDKLNKLVVPFGKRSSLILADGSKIWLNSGTELSFPSSFTGDTREITVEGEIYIDVAKQDRSFIINTRRSRISVFGTSFNVTAYADDTKESVVLVEGSVQVQSDASVLLLSPNQLAEIENGTIKSKNVDISEYISWKNGFMQLYKSPLSEVLIKIGRYYNVEFRYSGNSNLANKTCSGKLVLFEDINDFLQAFTEMTELNYEKESGNIIHIKH